MDEHVHMVVYTTYIDADFGAEPIYTHAGPFASEDAAQYWIDNNEDEYQTNLHGYPDPQIQEHPIRTVEDLQ
ncbi:MAG: hypothetical protein ABEH81_01475 [Halopenitus sp.]